MRSSTRALVFAAAAACAGAAAAQAYDITTLDPPQSYFTIIPFGINAAGTVTGVWVDPGQVDHGFLAAGGAFSSFDAPQADTTKVIGVRGTWAGGIDDAGTVVGVYTAGGAQHGFVRDAAGTTTTLDIAGHLHTQLFAINDNGVVLGAYADGDSVYGGTSFLRSAAGTLTTIAMPGASFTEGEGLNDAGTVVGGWIDAAGALHGFERSAAGVYTTIDVAGADATIPAGINAGGWIVGEYDVGAISHGYVQDPLGRVTTLDVPGATFTSGVAINAAGVLVGQYCDAADNCHGFVATPVPEPASALLAGAGALLLALRRRFGGERRS